MTYLLHGQLAESAKAQFAGREFSDHLATVRAYDGWKAAEREQSGNEYCWRNFLSIQTLRAIDSLRKQFYLLLKESKLIARDGYNCNTWSHDDHLVRAIICAGLFPGVCSVVVSNCYMHTLSLLFVYLKSTYEKGPLFDSCFIKPTI